MQAHLGRCLICFALIAVDVSLAGEYTLTATPARVAPGETLEVSWTAPSGGTSAGDWIGMFAFGSTNQQYLTYQYTAGATSGTFHFQAPGFLGFYEFRYLLNDDYVHTAVSNTVEVVSGGTGVDGPEVLLLRGGESTTDSAIELTLETQGFRVTQGPTIPEWNGTQANLADYSAVVLPHNYNWTRAIPPDGMAALSDFVLEGGGLVTGEWALWGAFDRNQSELLQVAPISEICGYNFITTTTYSQATLDPLIHDGLPESFEIELGNLAGTESCFGARPEATVFFTSSNGGGRADADGLVGWDYGRGRVASYSTLITNVELSNPDYARLLGNTVNWVMQGGCTTAVEAAPATVGAFGDCLTGPGGVIEVGCEPQDLNCSGHIDLRDVAFFQRTYGVL